ncbi:MAG: nucleotidyltransferase domain-containing protein [Candidatus Caldatribacterium sp.]|nr:nucleotidyltransferase domain-containing protein [Candidatus Caldatribacterium sp.]
MKWCTMDQEGLNRVLRNLAERYAHLAGEYLDENLVSVVLFGSVARGEATQKSDIDLLIVCRDLPKGMFKRHAFLEPIREQLQNELEELWKQGIYADFTELVYTKDEADRFHWIYLDMIEDAVLLYDREDFLLGVFERLRKRLDELGAQRKTLGKIRYYDLKPDLRAGEVIEL